MEKLQTEFEKRGFKFLQLWRNNKFALYEVTNAETKDMFYEFIKIKIANESNFRGKHFDKREIYPSDNEWGLNGFTYRHLDAETKEHILNKFHHIVFTDELFNEDSL